MIAPEGLPAPTLPCLIVGVPLSLFVAPAAAWAQFQQSEPPPSLEGTAPREVTPHPAARPRALIRPPHQPGGGPLGPPGELAAPGQPGWIADERTKCYFFEQFPVVNETIRRTAGCRDGLLSGPGVLERQTNGLAVARFNVPMPAVDRFTLVPMPRSCSAPRLNIAAVSPRIAASHQSRAAPSGSELTPWPKARRRASWLKARVSCPCAARPYQYAASRGSRAVPRGGLSAVQPRA